MNFHFARALAWAAVGIRAAATRQYGAATITLLGAITTMLPAFAHKAPTSWYIRCVGGCGECGCLVPVQAKPALGHKSTRYVAQGPAAGQALVRRATAAGLKWGVDCRWRPAILIADNVLQVVLGCYTHDTIYPPIETGSWRSAFVLLSGNGVAWLLFSGLWGKMTFRYAFPGQVGCRVGGWVVLRGRCAACWVGGWVAGAVESRWAALWMCLASG